MNDYWTEVRIFVLYGILVAVTLVYLGGYY